MTQTTFGQTDALALAAVAKMKALVGLAVAIAPTRRFSRRLKLANGDINPSVPPIGQAAWVDVFPGRGHETRDGGGSSPVFKGEYSIHFTLIQKVGADNTGAADAQCALLALTVSQIVEAFKPVQITIAPGAAVNNFGAVLNDVDQPSGQPYDRDVLEQDQCFCSENVLTFSVNV